MATQVSHCVWKNKRNKNTVHTQIYAHCYSYSQLEYNTDKDIDEEFEHFLTENNLSVVDKVHGQEGPRPRDASHHPLLEGY